MSEGEPPRPPPNFKKQNGGLCAQNWRAIACPPLGSGIGRPADRYRIERAYFYGGFGRGVTVTVTEWGRCCDPVVIEKLLDP